MARATGNSHPETGKFLRPVPKFRKISVPKILQNKPQTNFSNGNFYNQTNHKQTKSVRFCSYITNMLGMHKPNQVIKWYISYLSGRVQYTCEHRPPRRPDRLWCMESDPLPAVRRRPAEADQTLVPHAYADDIQIYGFCRPSSVNCLADRVSAGIDEVSSWMMSNRLQVNPSKTEVLWCSSSRRQYQIPTSPVRIDSTYVLPVTSVRDLGLYIDCDASLQTHVTAMHCQIVLRCLTADTQCSAVSPTARPAVAHPCVSRQQGLLLLLSAGRRLPSVVIQAAVHSQRRCSTCILRQAFGAHHSDSPRASLAAGSGAENYPR